MVALCATAARGGGVCSWQELSSTTRPRWTPFSCSEGEAGKKCRSKAVVRLWPCHSTDGARVQEVEMFVKEGDLGPKLLPAAAKKLAGMSLDDQ